MTTRTPGDHAPTASGGLAAESGTAAAAAGAGGGGAVGETKIGGPPAPPQAAGTAPGSGVQGVGVNQTHAQTPPTS